VSCPPHLGEGDLGREAEGALGHKSWPVALLKHQGEHDPLRLEELEVAPLDRMLLPDSWAAHPGEELAPGRSSMRHSSTALLTVERQGSLSRPSKSCSSRRSQSR
jgi:hypothetical protein